jgi:putative membrane protein
VTALVTPTLQFLSLSVSLPVLGLVTFAVTGLLVMLTAEAVPGFRVANFWWALVFAFVLSGINAFFHLSRTFGGQRHD